MVTLVNALAVVLLGALVLYALSGGADYGGGMWDLLATPPRVREQREAIEAAIAPIWEANHVWLILVITVLFTAFPPAFSAMMTALHIPFTLVLLGIVFRGAAFVFRKYDRGDDATHRRWSTIFGISSLLTPFFLGVCLGSLSSGEIRVEAGQVTTGFVAGWTSPFALACGLFAQGTFAFLAAVYLTVDTDGRPVLQEDFRRRGLYSGIALVPIALLVLLLSKEGAPVLFERLTSGRTLVLMTGGGIAAMGALGGLWRRAYQWARVAAAAQVTLILLGWGVAQYPYLIVPDVRLAGAAAPTYTLTFLVVALGVGALFLFPAFGYLFYVFKQKGAEEESPNASA